MDKVDITVNGTPSQIQRFKVWLTRLEQMHEVEIIHSRQWVTKSNGIVHLHLKIRPIGGQLNVLDQAEPPSPSLVLGNGNRQS